MIPKYRKSWWFLTYEHGGIPGKQNVWFDVKVQKWGLASLLFFWPHYYSNSTKIFAGIEDSVIPSNLNATQDFQRALSLLSTNSLSTYETKSTTTLEHSNHTAHTVTAQPITHSMIHRFPRASSEYWETYQQPVDSRMGVSYSDCDDGNHFPDFQLFKASYESGFPCNQLD